MDRKNFKILVVDDEPAFSLLLSRILADEGYRVKTAATPREALVMVENDEPDLILTDLKMPGMDGIEFIDAAKNRYPETDFVMITAHATVESAVTIMKMGAL